MKLTEKIDSFMKVNNIRDYMTFSKLTNIPYTTLKGLYEKGYENAKSKTLMRLRGAMACTLDELTDDTIDIDFEDRGKQILSKSYELLDKLTSQNVYFKLEKKAKEANLTNEEIEEVIKYIEFIKMRRQQK